MNPRFTSIPLNDQQKSPELRVFLREFSHPGEREELMKKQQISSSFDMRYRGLFHYYGDDLIDYKLKKGSGKHANEFLRIFSSYLTDYLEDDSPPSWHDCQPVFWEELLYAHFPMRVTISKKRRETDIFLLQLKRFVRWLDQRVGTSSYPTVEKYTEEALSELKTCEHLLNQLVLTSYPSIHDPNWNMEEELKMNNDELNACTDMERSLFEVSSIFKDILTIHDLHTKRGYQIYGIPTQKLQPGLLIQGVIGKKQDDFLWKWHITESIFPAKAKDFPRLYS